MEICEETCLLVNLEDHTSGAIKKQMASIFTVVFGRSLRLGGSDSSSIVLQSLGSGGGPTYSAVLDNQLTAGVPTSSGHHHARRYSGTQDVSISATQQSGRNTINATESDQFIHILSSAFAAPASATGSLNSAGQRSAQSQIDVATADVENRRVPSSASSSPPQSLRRQNSSPALVPSVDNQTNVNSSGNPTAPVTSGNLVQTFLHRTPSAGILSSLAGVNATVRNNEISSNPSSSSTGTPSSSAALQRASGNNMTDRDGLNSSGVSANLDATDSTSQGNSGFGAGVLARTRRFGAWLGRVTEGEKVEVTKKDLNVFAPTSF